MNGQRTKLIETVSAPDCVQKGDLGTRMAVKLYPRTPLTEKHLVVVYKELNASDGFILTAYFATGTAKWREVLWSR